MPPKQKNTPRNPFFFFMMDWKKDQMSKGHNVPTSLKLLAQAASPDWQNISEERKEYYKEKSRIAKEEYKTNLHNKFTTDGKSYAQVYAEEQETNTFIAKMKKEITDTVSSISQNIKSLISHQFYLIHANHYCYWDAKKIYIPCEVAIAEYSIEQGVSDTLHFFPIVLATPEGKLPLGYLRDAQEIAERTHRVPLPPWEEAEDYESVAARLCSFLQRSGTSEIPPLYTQENNVNCNNSMSTVKDFLINCEGFCDVQFRIYNLPQLFFELRNACADLAVREDIDPNPTWFPTLSLAEMELDRDIFHFSQGISCPYHEDLCERDIDNLVSQYCSLSTVQRWCFLLSDYCCKDVGVCLKTGKHCPPSTQLDLLKATNEGFGWNPPNTSKPKNKPQFVDDPPPPVNCWGKGPPKNKEVTTPNSVTNSTAADDDDDDDSLAGAEAGAGRANNSNDDFPSLDGLRLPKTRGRGERLIAAINRIKLDAKEDFPALGGGRGRGRL